jgi:short subunit dehydrogenase-like uncharacterized protein
MSDSAKWMIYGANGYTGRLIAVEAKRRGLKPVLAGRSADPILTLAAELGLPAQIFDLSDVVSCTARFRRSRSWRIAPARSPLPVGQ